ncbi:MAG: amidohydrolase family protein [Candidatus Hodarchaeota archaeon]
MASYSDMEDLMTEENIAIVKEKEELLHGGSKNLVKLFLLMMDHYGIDKAQVFSVIPADNEFMSKMKKFGENRLLPLGMVSPKEGDLEGQLEHVRKLGLYGLKIHPDFQKLDFKAPEFSEIFAFCEENKMLVISHTGSHGNLRDIVAQAKDFPSMPFIVGHMGLGPQVDQAYKAACDHENVYLEISGQGYTYKIQQALEDPRIGPGKILYGSDFPGLAPQVEIEKILSLDTTPEIKQKIFCGNIIGLYKKIGVTL